LTFPAVWFLGVCCAARAEDRLVEDLVLTGGEKINYLLTVEAAMPRYLVVLMPGGAGKFQPHRAGEGEAAGLKFLAPGNFLIRSRGLFADQQFAAACTDATDDPSRMQAILDDLARRFPGAEAYVIGTSRSTLSSMSLARSLDGKAAGFIHTSSMADIQGFDPRRLKSRNLIVHHRHDQCRATPFFFAERAHDRYGTMLIAVDGGEAWGDPCEPHGHHGYNGIERETVEQIKAWIRAKDGKTPEPKSQ
jgi:hypothetical protein